MSLSIRVQRTALALGVIVTADLLLPSLPIGGPAPAHAIVGAPLSPVSVAGVARRTTRRAVVATSATAAAAAPTTVVVQQAPAAPPPPKPQ